MDGERLLLIQLSSATARYFYQFRLSLSLSFCWPIAPWLITSWWSDGQDPHPIAFTACANIIHFDSINTIVLFAMTPAKCGFLDSIVSAALNRSRHDVDVSLLCRARLEDDTLYRKPLFGFSLLFLLLLPPPHSLRHRLFRLERDSVSDVTPTGLPPFSRRGSASTASGDSPERK